MKIISIVLIASVWMDLAVYSIISFDLEYVRTNQLELAQYDLLVIFSWNWIIALVYFSVRYFNPSYIRAAQIIIAIMHIFSSTNRIIVRINLFGGKAKCWNLRLLCDAIYVVFAYQMGIIIMSNYNLDEVDLDYFPVIFSVLLFYTVKFIVKKRLSDFMATATHIHRSCNSSLTYLRNLYYFSQNQSGKYTLPLYGCILGHFKKCSNPYCLCFQLKFSYDIQIGMSSIKSISGLNKIFNQQQRGLKGNGLAMFDDLVAIETAKSLHQGTFITRTNKDTQTVSVIRSNEPLPADAVDFVLDLGSSDKFKMFMCSCLRDVKESQDGKRVFPAIIDILRFLTFEYKNYVAGLLAVYDFVYSRVYARESNIWSNILLQNYIYANRSLLTKVEQDIFPTPFPRMKLAKILNYRLRVHSLRSIMRTLIMGKIEIYSTLCGNIIPYTPLSKIVEAYTIELNKAKSEFEYLLETGPRNLKLNREAIMFELCVLEMPIVSKKLKKNYTEALIDTRNREGSVHSYENMRGKLSYFNSSNIVIFVRNINSTFRIYHYTANASDLLGVKRQELQGMAISDFMPPQLAQVHDRLIMNYLNGSSQSMKSGRIFTAITSKYAIRTNSCRISRSVMIVPKLDYLISDDIYMGAFISIRRKNNTPTIYTDQSGNIVGANMQASKAIGKRITLEKCSLFLMFPRLFQVYYPDLKLGLQHIQSLQESMNEDSSQKKKIQNSISSKGLKLNPTRVNLGEKGELGTHLRNSPEINSRDREQPATENLLDDYRQGNSYTSGSFEFFHFQMFTKNDSENLNQTDFVESSRSLSPYDPAFVEKASPLSFHLVNQRQQEEEERWKDVKESFAKGRFFIPPKFKLVSKILSQQRKLLVENLSNVFKVKATIETQYYQRNICLREISLVSIKRPGNSTLQFFRIFAESSNPLFLDVLMLSPESLKMIFRLCLINLKIKEYEKYITKSTGKVATTTNKNTSSFIVGSSFTIKGESRSAKNTSKPFSISSRHISVGLDPESNKDKSTTSAKKDSSESQNKPANIPSAESPSKLSKNEYQIISRGLLHRTKPKEYPTMTIENSSARGSNRNIGSKLDVEFLQADFANTQTIQGNLTKTSQNVQPTLEEVVNENSDIEKRNDNNYLNLNTHMSSSKRELTEDEKKKLKLLKSQEEYYMDVLKEEINKEKLGKIVNSVVNSPLLRRSLAVALASNNAINSPHSGKQDSNLNQSPVDKVTTIQGWSRSSFISSLDVDTDNSIQGRIWIIT